MFNHKKAYIQVEFYNMDENGNVTARCAVDGSNPLEVLDLAAKAKDRLGLGQSLVVKKNTGFGK